MKRIKYLIPILIMFIAINVKAIDACTPEEMNRLRELAKNVQFKTNYNMLTAEDGIDDLEVVYHLNVINFNNDLSIYMKTNDDEEFKIIDPNNMDDKYFFEGEVVTFKIYSHTTNLCTNELLNTNNIKFDYYNYWYYKNKDNCNKYHDFKYCKEFMKTDKNDEEIDKLFNEYKKEINGENDSKILDFISNYKYIIIIIVSIIIIGVTVFIILKRNKKERI